MASIFSFLCLFILLFYGSTTNAEPSRHISELKQAAQFKQLHLHRSWLAILHYRPTGLSGYVGEADDAQFFLTSTGKFDPEAELYASLEALFSLSDDEEHILCRYPLRSQWLIETLDIQHDNLPRPSCTNYYKWRKKLGRASVKLIFPSAYLSSPSSMFGHLFLRFDSSETSNTLLSNTLNYAALTNHPDNSNQLIGGLFTGIVGKFSIKPYYIKLKEYSDIENRDIWEYSLHLQNAGIEKLIDHAWEIRDIKFDYYFFDENCAYRILSIIEAIKPELDLLRNFQLTAAPVEVIRALDRQGVIGAIKYTPSSKSHFKSGINSLSLQEQRWVTDIALGNIIARSEQYTRIVTDNPEILVLAIEYLSILINEDKALDRQVNQKLVYNLLSNSDSVESVGQQKKTEFTKLPPNQGHNMRKLSLYYGAENTATDSATDVQHPLELEFRYGYHSLLDPNAGFETGNQVEGFKLRVSHYSSNIRLEQLDLVDIKCFTPSNEYFSDPSWEMAFGFARSPRNHDKLGFYFNYASGKSFLYKKGIYYGLLKFDFDQNQALDKEYDFGIGVKLGSLFSFNGQTLSFNASSTYYTVNQPYLLKASSLAYVFFSNNQSSVQTRIQYEKNGAIAYKKIGIEYSRYF